MAKVYFTYAREEDSVMERDRDLILRYLKKRIEAISHNQVSAIYDKTDFREGKNYLKCEKEINECDSILVFFTPEYKRKAESLENYGVKREYEFINKRFKEREDGDDSIIPILLSGRIETSFTKEFEKNIPWDISQVKSQISHNKRGKTVFGPGLRKQLNAIARKAIKEAHTYNFCKNNSFSTNKGIEEQYKALFLDAENGKLPSECLIKTSAHESVLDQKSYFVIGRKGSGKTTLLNSLQSDPKGFIQRFKTLVSLDANTIDIDFIYSDLIQQIRNDLNTNIIGLERVLDVFWSTVFFLQGVYIIGIEMEKCQINDTDYRYKTFDTMTKQLRKLLGVPKGDSLFDQPKGSVCRCAVELLSNHIKKHIIDNACEETPYTAAFTSVTSELILRSAFSNNVYHKYCQFVGQCTKQIFLVLDNFDTHAEDFRKTTNQLKDTNPQEYEFRKNFEIRLFRELLLTAYSIKQNTGLTKSEKEHYSAVGFCIILPQDRFDEISKDDRDYAKRRICSLSWDAYDLLNMLVKRLESYYKISKEPLVSDLIPDPNLLNRFYKIIEEYMPSIPTEIPITVEGNTYKMQLYNYLLRLSFWRPRDMIMNFAVIMELSKYEGYSTDVLQNIIKSFLVTSARKIIDQEFLAEYKHVYPNLENVIMSFKDSNLILDYSSFSSHLAQQTIVSTTSKKLETIDEKISLFYELGIIGLFFKDRKTYRRYESNYHISYCFNEGMTPLKLFLKETNRDTQARFVFNPIFYKFLSLNMKNKEVIGDFPWTYIMNNHVLKDNIHRI